MARYNQLGTARFNRFVQKLFQIKGLASLLTVRDDLGMGVNFYNGVENRYLEGWDRFMSFPFLAGVAAQNTGVRVRNPSGSNVVAVFEKIAISVTGANSNVLQTIEPVTVDYGGVIANPTNQNIDSRGRKNPTCIMSAANAVANSTQATNQYPLVATLAAGDIYDVILTDNAELTLFPGFTISWITQTNNVSLLLNLLWRERFLEDSERA